MSFESAGGLDSPSINHQIRSSSSGLGPTSRDGIGTYLLRRNDVFREVSGSLEYTDSYGELAQVTEKAYVAEAVLWTNWKHRGTLTLASRKKQHPVPHGNCLCDVTSCQNGDSQKDPRGFEKIELQGSLKTLKVKTF